jgi:hypothetical protein
MVLSPQVLAQSYGSSPKETIKPYLLNQLYTTFNTMTINNRSTKAEILSAYTEIKTKAETPTITVDATVNTVNLVFKELAALVSDVYHLGVWSRKNFNHFVSVYRGT